MSRMRVKVEATAPIAKLNQRFLHTSGNGMEPAFNIDSAEHQTDDRLCEFITQTGDRS
jgi:hypothetical protein